jgi:hypothetical protein
VADADLTTAYLEAVNEHLTLPDDERAAAVEELAGHIEESVVAAAEHGVGRDAAVRRALERLGAPQRLASDITDAHRLPGHALAAAGTALRVSIKTGIGAYILAWAGILAVALFFGLVLAGLRKIFGPALLEADFSPATDGLMPAVVAVIVALTLGNALVAPVAVTARRPVGAVRIALVAVGVPIVAFVVVTMVTARWNPWSVLLMASAPAWYALGVARSGRLPIPRVGLRAVLVTAIGIIVGSMALLSAAGGVGSVQTFEDVGTPFDPNVRYAAIGSFVDIEHPPVVVDISDASHVWYQGPGPVPLARSATLRCRRRVDASSTRGVAGSRGPAERRRARSERDRAAGGCADVSQRPPCERSARLRAAPEPPLLLCRRDRHWCRRRAEAARLAGRGRVGVARDGPRMD